MSIVIILMRFPAQQRSAPDLSSCQSLVVYQRSSRCSFTGVDGLGTGLLVKTLIELSLVVYLKWICVVAEACIPAFLDSLDLLASSLSIGLLNLHCLVLRFLLVSCELNLYLFASQRIENT